MNPAAVPAFTPADAAFESRTRESFSRQGAMALLGAKLGRVVARGEVIRAGKSVTVTRFDVFVEREGERAHCATGLATMMRMVARPGTAG